MLQRFKTSTQISLKFTAFSAGILLLVGVIMNAFFFSFWYTGLTKEKPRVNQPANSRFAPEKKFGSREYRLALGSDEANEILDEKGIFSIVEMDSYHLYVEESGGRLIVRDISAQVKLQTLLLWISMAVIVGGTFLSYLVSLFFVKTALKKLNALNDALQTLDIDRLNHQLPIRGHPKDEINTVIRKFNQALTKIHNQTLGLKDFVRNASHELKTPLMGMQAIISLARKSGDAEAAFLQLKSEIAKVDSLLENLLLITQVEEKLQLPTEEVELVAGIQNLLTQLEHQHQSKNLTVSCDLPPSLTKNVNPQGRNSIITNLITNAFKFVEENGEIKITLNENHFSVRNNGAAIPEEHLEKIWERFWQADTARTESKSFGLGLYLSRLFAQKQGFDLKCESKAGEGVRFILKFGEF